MGSVTEVRSIPAHVLDIAESALSRAGRTPSGPPTLRHHSSISTILTFPSDDGTVWFKHVPPIFFHEGEVTACLARIAPERLPKILAWDRGWMLMEEFPTGDRPAFEHPLAALARIQRASIDHLADLAASKCYPQPLDMLVAKLVEFEKHSTLLTSDQVRALNHSLQHVSDAGAKMARLFIPTTVVHGDFYCNNVHWGSSGWIVYDWTDSFLGNPFIDVADPLMRQEPGAAEAFRRVWLEVLPPETVTQALDLAPALGAAHCILMIGQIMEHVSDPEPFRASFDMWLRRLALLAHRDCRREGAISRTAMLRDDRN